MKQQQWDGPGTSKRRAWKHVVLTRRVAPDVESRFDPGALRTIVRDTRTAFTRFWRRTPWGRPVRDPGSRQQRMRRDCSYIAAVEVAPRGMVHIHALVYGEYVAQCELQELWGRVLGEPLAILYIRDIRSRGPEGIAAALREVLKYATKGEKGCREQVRHAAAVELAFREVHRVSIGGALRSVKVNPTDGQTDDVQPEDLHDRCVAACEACGTVGKWRWVGIVGAKTVEWNGGFGLVRRPRPPVIAAGP